MKETTTVAIVGAGIAGITAAYFEARKGHKVYLIELSPRAGGLLKSDSHEFGTFDYGTHVAGDCGLAELDEFLFGGMTEEDYLFFNPGDSGNYYGGILSEISPFVNTAVLPEHKSIRASLELLKAKGSHEAENLEELMIARFGKLFYREVMKEVVSKFMGKDPVELTKDAIYFFDMNRVLAFDAETTDRLKKIDNYDEALGYHYPAPGARKIYPRKGGIGSWIDFLMEKLEKEGVSYLAGTKITSVLEKGGKVEELALGDKVMAIDELIWSVPPAFLSRLLDPSSNFPRPRFRKTGLYDFAFDQPLDTKCFYINVYDPALHSARLSIYQNLAQDGPYYGCTTEVLADDIFDFEAKVDDILGELKTIGLLSDEHNCVYKGYRSIRAGFPVPEIQFLEQSEAMANALDEKLKNVRFIGRGNGRFFMKDILKHTYQSCAKELIVLA
ncbi:MAG: FAD-dependent oxidoreductase [Bacteroidia bacterium]|nr:FAD-dependent oxidoreductase [Bacteroidia bacterium]